MTNFKIKVNIEFVETEEEEQVEPEQRGDGQFEFTISEADATNIDKCDKAILKASFPTIRNAVSHHLTEISKKKANKVSRGKKVVVNDSLYGLTSIHKPPPVIGRRMS